MKIVTLLSCLIAAGVFPCAASSSSLDVATSDPAHRRIVFENDHVRVNELFAPTGAESKMHVQEPGVLISVNKVRFEMTSPEGEVSVVDHQPGEVLWLGMAQQRRWKVLAGTAHIFLVEVKSAASGEMPASTERDARHSTRVDPDQHHQIVDNEHVCVIDGMGRAGARSPAHTHPPSVLVSLAKSRFRVTINDRTRIFDFEPMTVRWTNHFEHTWEILAGDARVIMVEIKSAHNAPQFKRRM